MWLSSCTPEHKVRQREAVCDSENHSDLAVISGLLVKINDERLKVLPVRLLPLLYVCSCVVCLTWQLQAGVSCGGAGQGGRVSTVSHVWLWMMGLPVHHCQPKSQPLSVGLSSETDKHNTYRRLCRSRKKFAQKLEHSYKDITW